MPRFLHVVGKAGVLVVHPGAPDANPRRFAGQRELPADAKPSKAELVGLADHYEPVDELHAWSPELVGAGKRGELARCDVIEAPSREAAERKFQAALEAAQRAAAPVSPKASAAPASDAGEVS
jgi:hypothetical protein